MELVSLKQLPRQTSADAISSRAGSALAGVIGCTGESNFGSTAIAELNKMLPLCWMSVYKLFKDGPPEMYIAGTFGVADGTRDSWRVYRRGLYSRDQTFAAAREVTQGGGAALTRWHARELPLEHRRAIYTRHGLRERISLIEGDKDGGLLAVNLYRSEEQAPFVDHEIDLLCGLTAPLLAAVQLHLRLMTSAAQAIRVREPLEAKPSSALVEEISSLSELPRREREVCQRLLRGWTYDGIAADLGISAGTVKTYRDRAFDRLGLHHRNELFAKALAEATG